MKRTLLILGVTSVFVASLSAFKPEPKTEPAITIAAPAIPKIATMQMSGGELLIAKSDCIGCHHKINKLIGPSYTDVAKKYPKNDKSITYLADKIIKGGSGVWGKIPMTPHPKISQSDAKLMAKYILSLKK
ncbi:c-type cytochrome [Pedobacter sp. SL55]|uniref:c-type cytochrome n=1 Tax=Pedobacter sp. SL55 TaxID=2995161 RepID=UPI002270950F|nr:c-type cytochrome [Pedobacter sp. SL55]WAC39151.1 cytochrome C552 [Pedobacter sp. SL55]